MQLRPHQISTTGTIIDVGKGFGFIQDDDGTERIFFRRDLQGVEIDDLFAGDRVEFQPFETNHEKHPLRAGRVRPLSD